MRIFYSPVIALVALIGATQSGHANQATCVPVSGVMQADADGESHYRGTLSGTLAGVAHLEITGETDTRRGREITLRQVLSDSHGGTLYTDDTATLTPVDGMRQVYVIEILYDIKDATGPYAGYVGAVQSYGVIDMIIGQIVLRYKGELCPI